jgi:hypothetical protein
MRLVAGDDAGLHQATGEADWRESYYLNFADVESDVHGIVWQGVRPNSGAGEAVFIVFDGDKPLLESVEMRVEVAADVGAERQRMGNQEFTCLEPWKHWRISFDDGESQVELDWTRMADYCDWEWKDLQNSTHYQAAGHVAGTIRLPGRELAIRGYGERDRAWGKRNYGPISFLLNLMAHFPDDAAVHALVMRDPDGKLRLSGYLHLDGSTAALDEYDLDVTYQEPGRPPADARHRVRDVEGRELEIAETSFLHALEFGTDQGGAQLEDRKLGDQAKGRMFLGAHRFVRADGTVGRGCIDMNFWLGHEEDEIRARGPVYSSLYAFGRE